MRDLKKKISKKQHRIFVSTALFGLQQPISKAYWRRSMLRPCRLRLRRCEVRYGRFVHHCWLLDFWLMNTHSTWSLLDSLLIRSYIIVVQQRQVHPSINHAKWSSYLLTLLKCSVLNKYDLYYKPVWQKSLRWRSLTKLLYKTLIKF